jgi:hypothetical protein
MKGRFNIYELSVGVLITNVLYLTLLFLDRYWDFTYEIERFVGDYPYDTLFLILHLILLASFLLLPIVFVIAIKQRDRYLSLVLIAICLSLVIFFFREIIGLFPECTSESGTPIPGHPKYIDGYPLIKQTCNCLGYETELSGIPGGKLYTRCIGIPTNIDSTSFFIERD